MRERITRAPNQNFLLGHTVASPDANVLGAQRPPTKANHMMYPSPAPLPVFLYKENQVYISTKVRQRVWLERTSLLVMPSRLANKRWGNEEATGTTSLSEANV